MRVYRPLPVEHAYMGYIRGLVRECRALLNQPVPDTFLGRRTYEAFPREDEPGRDAWDEQSVRVAPVSMGQSPERVNPGVTSRGLSEMSGTDGL